MLNANAVNVMKSRSAVLGGIRDFFDSRGYLEADTPILAGAVIPEAHIELFSTRLVSPYGEPREMFMLPSPEYYLKMLIAAGAGNIYEISRCFRNSEQQGRLHSPEFTMLEWYTMGADYMDSIAVTEKLFDYLIDEQRHAGLGGEHLSKLQPPFQKMTMTEAFAEFAAFDLSAHCTGKLSPDEELAQLRTAAGGAGLRVSADDSWEELFNHIFVHQVEPRLPEDSPLIIYNYPSGVPALAGAAEEPGRLERWELYAGGIELANCYSEETRAYRVREFFAAESAEKQEALVPVKPDENWCNMYSEGFPACSGAALGIDRLIMLLRGAESLEGVISFPLSDIIPE